jgi:glyoxylase-like metal-dependent hydrolase (beta-lactamase superfamily II)
MNPKTQPGQFSRQTRSTFLARTGLGLLGAILGSKRAWSAEPASTPSIAPEPKGKANSKLERWDLITIGNLSRNRYWGESDAKGLRPAICTCTLIRGDGFRLLVDPSLEKLEDMARELDRRTGLKIQDINAVFITHEHGDHSAGLAHFPNAKWFAGPEIASILNSSKQFSKAIEPATGKLFDVVEIVPTPGHTMGHQSLRFDCDGLSVVVAGDAVATRDFWRERRGFYNCVDFELAAKSMSKIAGIADFLAPGHDNYFPISLK